MQNTVIYKITQAFNAETTPVESATEVITLLIKTISNDKPILWIFTENKKISKVSLLTIFQLFLVL